MNNFRIKKSSKHRKQKSHKKNYKKNTAITRKAPVLFDGTKQIIHFKKRSLCLH